MQDFESLKNTVISGDVRHVFSQIPDDFVQTIITSPPYFGHRKYSGEESFQCEIGRESNLEEYIQNLTECFDILKPKLKNNGLLWLNLGDTYRNQELLGVPWRVAFALQDQGWILRSDIIWKKNNAMPSSVKNRPTTEHEYIFLFSKTKDYFYDSDAIREPHVTFSDKSQMKGGRKHFGQRNGTPEKGKNSGNSNLHNSRWDQAFHPNGRNKRTIWEIPLSKFKDAHFAVYPEKLVEICLLASTKSNDFVLDPFTGSGTTGVVAKKNNRNFIGIELVEKYQRMAQKRINETHYQTELFMLQST